MNAPIQRRGFLASLLGVLGFSRLPAPTPQPLFHPEPDDSWIDLVGPAPGGSKSNIIGTSWADCTSDIPADLLELNRRYEEMRGYK